MELTKNGYFFVRFPSTLRFPTEHFIILEPWNIFNNVSKEHKDHRSTCFETLKVWDDRSGCLSLVFFYLILKQLLYVWDEKIPPGGFSVLRLILNSHFFFVKISLLHLTSSNFIHYAHNDSPSNGPVLMELTKKKTFPYALLRSGVGNCQHWTHETRR